MRLWIRILLLDGIALINDDPYDRLDRQGHIRQRHCAVGDALVGPRRSRRNRGIPATDRRWSRQSTLMNVVRHFARAKGRTQRPFVPDLRQGFYASKGEAP